jgi:hypothetical protein
MGNLLASTSDRPMLAPWAHRKVLAMAPPKHTASARPSKLSSSPILSATLAPPMMATKGRWTSPSSLPSIFASAIHQEAHALVCHVLDHPDGGGVGAVGCAEGIVDVDVGVGGQGAREVFVVGFFARRKAQVFQNGNPAIAQIVHDLLGAIASWLVGQNHVAAKGLGQIGGNRKQGEFGLDSALGAAEVRGQHHASTALNGVGDGGQAFADAGCIGHASGRGERDIEVHAYEHPSTLKVQIGNAFCRHESAASTRKYEDFPGY